MVMICTICARGGSKGLPGKNIKPLMGKPLIAWSIEQARAAGIFNRIAVSSDSQEILDVAGDFGADILINRPPELASDTSGKLPAIIHAVQTSEERTGLRFDTIVDLDVTSPLRTPDDIKACVALLKEEYCTNVLTGTPSHRSPYFNMVEFDKYEILRLCKANRGIERRQDAPKTYDMNASIYVWRRDEFFAMPKLFYAETKLYEMPPERSWDIDNPMDFEIVELLMRKQCQA